MKPKIRKFGFEIEGEMSERLTDALIAEDFGSITSDGSLRRCNREKTIEEFHSEKYPLILAEFISSPMTYDRRGKAEANKIFKMLNDFREEKEFHWNKSMGFHIHLSFRPKMPVDVWSVEFAKFFTDRMAGNFKTAFKQRKNNLYCKLDLNEEKIARRENLTCDDKYSFINFGYSFKEHGTIEFRVFPAQKPMTMKKYLYFTFRTVEYFLKHSGQFLNKSFEFETEEDEEPFEAEIERKVQGNKKQIIEFERSLDDTKRELNIEKKYV